MANLVRILNELQEERSRTKQELTRLSNAIAVMKQLVSNHTAHRARRARRTMSAAARLRISRAQKARWAKQRKAA